MGVGDELSFKVEVIFGKVCRIEAVALKVERDPTNRRDVALLKAMMGNFDNLAEEYSRAIEKLAAYNAKQTPKLEVDLQSELVKFEVKFYNVKAIAAVAVPDNEHLDTSIVSTGLHQVEHQPVAIALPKLSLSEFDGDLKNWTKFSDLFLATVHNNKQLSDIQKHMYLRSALKGEALGQIASLPLTGDNYLVAWDQLKNAYGDSLELADAYLEELVDLSVVSRDPKSLRSFIRSVVECTGALRALGYLVDQWSALLLFILKRKLNAGLRAKWTEEVLQQPIPDLDMFVKFVHKQVKMAEAAQPTQAEYTSSKKPSVASSPRNQTSWKRTSTFLTSTSEVNPRMDASQDGHCVICGSKHSVTNCNRFLKLKVFDRIRMAKNRKLCLCCLKKGHFLKNCINTSSCNFCDDLHHTLLHLKTRDTNTVQNNQQVVETSNENESSEHNTGVQLAAMQTSIPSVESSVLLSTARVEVLDNFGKYQQVRVLIDSASQGTFITSSCARRLGWKPKTMRVPVYGLAHTRLGDANGSINCSFRSERNWKLEVVALVVDSIANCPSKNIRRHHWPHLEKLKLADPLYFKVQPIDILIGAEWFAQIIVGNPIIGPVGAPNAVETIWGYVLVGKITQALKGIQTFCMAIENQLDSTLRKFWSVEEPPSIHVENQEDKACELHYKESVHRQLSGRYIVELPFRPETPTLGDSRQAALRRFYLLERRLERNKDLRSKYNEFMQDYLNQGHMVKAPNKPQLDQECYYVPHHCIYRDQDLSHFRVVFDASMKTCIRANNQGSHVVAPSLNDVLYVGPKLQLDLANLLILFRAHPIVLITDIRQMYRNIAINEKHFNFQRIFWRFQAEEELQEFCLTTVTYGVSSAPFLAIRTLHQLVQDEGRDFPDASKVILENTYMDDIVVSVSSRQQALRLQRELIGLLGKGKFDLRKWNSNSPEVLNAVPFEHCAIAPDVFAFRGEGEPAAKILGLIWNPVVDVLSFKVQLETRVITKRSILSEIARLFDPLGLICPVIFMGKWLIQHLWQLGLGWDDRPPDDVCQKWEQFRQELPLLSKLSFTRELMVDSATTIQLHGFSDASEKGYAGVVYIRTIQPNKDVKVSLVIAKSRVAPLKRVTLPRLELCGVVLVSELLAHVMEVLRDQCLITSVNIWTDSAVALSWIQSSPHRWKTFVATRVSRIQELWPPQNFRYVPSASNPADVASRGLLPQKLLECHIWKDGPVWLRAPEDVWPLPLDKSARMTVEGEDRAVVFYAQIENPVLENFGERFSSLSRLRRVVAYCRRFMFNSRHNLERRSGPLTVEELRAAELIVIKIVQVKEFGQDLKALKSGGPTTPRLKKFNPFVDETGILRVGGRLRHANIPYVNKFPIILPKKNWFTNLVIDFFHYTYLHPGPTNLHNIIRNKYWIISGRDVVRRRVLKCVACFRTHPNPIQPIMGNLPPARLQQVKAFAISGVDYGGPFDIKLGKIRNAKIYKGYICLFVCFVTRAIHLELVSDLSTDAFLAALRRFVARRGAINHIYSDCGTNFVGAKRKLQEWAQLLASSKHNEQVTSYLADRNIKWHLNPPSSPHFGGLWEAGIKSVKRLLASTVGSQILTYEEFYTVLTQVEATLNSRPLVPLSSDPEDLEALTPSHFLFQGPVGALPEPITTDGPVNYVKRWELLQQIVNSFWKRWKCEYLTTLQARTKWTNLSPNLTVGMMVLIKDNNLASVHWRLGRIVEVYPGQDKIVRVAKVKTKQGLFLRAVTKLCPLPNQ